MESKNANAPKYQQSMAYLTWVLVQFLPQFWKIVKNKVRVEYQVK